jgi:putative phosphoribosyl transferase
MQVATPPIDLPGTLAVPLEATGVVVFAQNGGPDEMYSPNSLLARTLLYSGLAILIFDLLAPNEARNQDNIILLADRVDYAIGFVRSCPETAGLPLCLFGTGTAAAAAFVSAASMPSLVGAVVSRAGRPELAEDMLKHVRAPTLFIVDGNDTRSLVLNLTAKARMNCHTELTTLTQPSHSIEETGFERHMPNMVADWFNQHAGRPCT